MELEKLLRSLLYRLESIDDESKSTIIEDEVNKLSHQIGQLKSDLSDVASSFHLLKDNKERISHTSSADNVPQSQHCCNTEPWPDKPEASAWLHPYRCSYSSISTTTCLPVFSLAVWMSEIRRSFASTAGDVIPHTFSCSASRLPKYLSSWSFSMCLPPAILIYSWVLNK